MKSYKGQAKGKRSNQIHQTYDLDLIAGMTTDLRCEDLRERIKEGRYRPSSDEIAEALIRSAKFRRFLTGGF